MLVKLRRNAGILAHAWCLQKTRGEYVQQKYDKLIHGTVIPTIPGRTSVSFCSYRTIRSDKPVIPP
jgi:hypothetical protein